MNIINILNKFILNFSEFGKQKTRFLLSSICNDGKVIANGSASLHCGESVDTVIGGSER